MPAFIAETWGVAMRHPPPPGRLVDAGGVRPHLRAMGDGNPLVVFDSGLGESVQERGCRHRADIIPAAVRYPRHPGAWITRWPPALQYAITFLAFPIFRRGATLNVGQPIDVRTLLIDPAEATRRLAAALDALL